MIYIDVDGVCVDFVGTAKKFGVELLPNEFGKWEWKGSPHFKGWLAKDGGVIAPVAPAEFYAAAEPQPWLDELMDCINKEHRSFITKDFHEEKDNWLIGKQIWLDVIEAPDKSVHCKHPTDLLIDDNLEECRRWLEKGGLAWHFNLAEADPFGEFLKWWRLQ